MTRGQFPYHHSDEPFPGIGSSQCASRGARSRAGFIAAKDYFLEISRGCWLLAMNGYLEPLKLALKMLFSMKCSTFLEKACVLLYRRIRKVRT